MRRKFAAVNRKRSIAMQSRQRVHIRSAERTNFIFQLARGFGDSKDGWGIRAVK